MATTPPTLASPIANIMATDDRAPKRRRSEGISAPNTPSMPPPEAIIDIYAEGDGTIVVDRIGGVQKLVGLRVSRQMLNISCPVLARKIDEAPYDDDDCWRKTIYLLADEGDTIYLLLNILHLRNEALPYRLDTIAFLRLIATAAKYSCLNAISRHTTQYLDHIYSRLSDAPLFELIETTYILNDATYFSRFTSKWVLTTPLSQTVADIISAKQPSATSTRLAIELLARKKSLVNEMKADIDLMIDPLSEALSEGAKHYHDCEPGQDPHPDELTGPNGPMTPQYCPVDREGATEYLSALRDSYLWPSSKWPDTNLHSLITRIAKFRIPDYDASDGCYWCLHVEDTFLNAVEGVRKEHEQRMWGLCLDCFKAGGVNSGECRVEHEKSGHLSLSGKGKRKGGKRAVSAAVADGLLKVEGQGNDEKRSVSSTF